MQQLHAAFVNCVELVIDSMDHPPQTIGCLQPFGTSEDGSGRDYAAERSSVRHIADWVMQHHCNRTCGSTILRLPGPPCRTNATVLDLVLAVVSFDTFNVCL